MVGFQDSINTVALRFIEVAVESKAMAYFIKQRHFCSKAIGWEQLVTVVIFQDIEYLMDCIRVLIAAINIWHIVERLGIGYFSVRLCKIDCNVYVDFTPSHNVVQESGAVGKLKAVDAKHTFSNVGLFGTSLELACLDD